VTKRGARRPWVPDSLYEASGMTTDFESSMRRYLPMKPYFAAFHLACTAAFTETGTGA